MTVNVLILVMSLNATVLLVNMLILCGDHVTYCFYFTGWNGKRCENQLFECDNNPCHNQAICLYSLSNSKFACYCVPGFYGTLCEKHFNHCLNLNLCENGGICIDGINNYTCQCQSGFVGKHCEIDCQNQSCCSSCSSITKDEVATVIMPKSTHDLPFTSSLLNVELSMLTPDLMSEGNFISPTINILPTQSLPENIFTTRNAITSQSTSKLSSSLSTSLKSLIVTKSSLSLQDSPSLSTFLLTSSITSSKSTQIHAQITSIQFPTKAVESIDFKIFMPHFNGRTSYLTFYHQDEYFSETLMINFYFKTIAEYGILVYSKSDTNPSAFILIYFDQGLLKLTMACNETSVLKMQSEKPLNDGILHKLSFNLTSEHSKCKVHLAIDNSPPSFGSQFFKQDTICFKKITFGRYLDNLTELESYPVALGFQGCLKFIHFNQVFKVNNAVDVNECDPHSICDQDPCHGHGKCISHDQTWECMCNQGYEGHFCERATCLQNPCKNNGICIPWNQTDFLCICNNGWFGIDCQLGKQSCSINDLLNLLEN